MAFRLHGARNGATLPGCTSTVNLVARVRVMRLHRAAMGLRYAKLRVRDTPRAADVIGRAVPADRLLAVARAPTLVPEHPRGAHAAR
jgi:hypothetical protein